MIAPDLMEILCCPESRQALTLASPEIIERLNRQIAPGTLRNRAGRAVEAPLEGGLIRSDGQYLYPIREGIPVLLVDEAIPLSG
jgi:uncharacterized protein YbaR (Trm112 family)